MRVVHRVDADATVRDIHVDYGLESPQVSKDIGQASGVDDKDGLWHFAQTNKEGLSACTRHRGLLTVRNLV